MVASGFVTTGTGTGTGTGEEVVEVTAEFLTAVAKSPTAATVGRVAVPVLLGNDGLGGATAEGCFLGPTNQVVNNAIGHKKKENSPQPNIERPRLRARTRQIAIVLKYNKTIASEDIREGQLY